ACNVCESCVSFNDGASLNIHELDAASNNSVDDIRTLTEQVRFSPQAGKYKVYIIDEVHMLSASAFNAFLKTLEEPPPYAIFILATTEKHKILPTILSRCQIFDFKRITPNDTVEHLQEICDKEKITSDKAALQVIAQKSEGCMRDALSILDKIVSFTNGELTYKNTLEHLNILDADYYFKLIEAMLLQDLAATLLLYDDINRKGFEGDLVLNGFAEFIRNLLVCRDESIAGLIEVVDSFKDRYVAAAQKVSPAWLISALNILNEAEIHYKGARNKKLHAELTLIKLTYLGQAVELVSEGGIVKKKITDTAKPVAFKSIRPAIAEPSSPGSTPSTIKKNRQATDAKLIIESSMIKEEAAPYGRTAVQPPTRPGNPVTGIKPAATSAAPAPTLGALSKVRKQIAQQQRQANHTLLPLTMENLQEAWNGYIDKLAQQKNHSAVTNFRLAQLRVADNNSFEIVVESNIQQKFIEQERGTLIEHLQFFYNNRSLCYTIYVEEAAATGTPQERPLSSRGQYLKMIEQYPMVKALKERLKLELDY
ncbi:MAG TPA: DNA polymerase III subunit gamma/tau, partial [Agriterribacter sp.]|nr:DNA polymerase III subunit gamma/tau [Agriterribacter sp.]